MISSKFVLPQPEGSHGEEQDEGAESEEGAVDRQGDGGGGVGEAERRQGDGEVCVLLHHESTFDFVQKFEGIETDIMICRRDFVNCLLEFNRDTYCSCSYPAAKASSGEHSLSG